MGPGGKEGKKGMAVFQKPENRERRRPAFSKITLFPSWFVAPPVQRATKPEAATRPFLGIEADVVDKESNSIGTGGEFAIIKKPWPSMMCTIHKDPDRYFGY